jgi:hypothetical protein
VVMGFDMLKEYSGSPVHGRWALMTRWAALRLNKQDDTCIHHSYTRSRKYTRPSSWSIDGMTCNDPRHHMTPVAPLTHPAQLHLPIP